MIGSGVFLGAWGVAGAAPTDAGPFKVALWGQSEDYYTLSEFHDALPHEPLVAEGRVTFWWHDRSNGGAAGVESVTVTADAVANDSRLTAGMVAMANTFMRRMPGCEIVLVMHTHSGTEPREIMDDAYVPAQKTALTKRHWVDDEALHLAATADGVQVGFLWHSWFAGPGSYGDDYGKAFAAFLWGRDLAGDLLTYSSGSPGSLIIGSHTWDVNHTLLDLYGETPTVVAMGGAHRFVPSSDPDLENATTFLGGGAQAAFQNKQKSTISWRALVASAAFSSRVVDTQLHINAHSIGFDDGGGVWADGAHPSGYTDEGINYRARQTAHAIMRGAGISSFAIPLIDQAEWQVDGSYMEFWSSAGPITTLRVAAGDPALPATHPHWTQVSGVQVEGEPAQRADLVAGRVRVYPNSGVFHNLSQVTFGDGGASGQLLYPEDLFNALYRDWPIIDLGLGDVPGLPLAHLPDEAVMTSTVPGTPTFTTTTDGPYFSDPSNIPAGTGAMTFVIEGVTDRPALGGAGEYFNLSGQQIQVILLSNNGAIRVTLRDDTSTYLLQSETSAAGIIQDGVDHTIVVSVDLAGQVFRLWVDGVLHMDIALAANSGLFSTSRFLTFMNGTASLQMIGEWKRLAVWREYTADGSIPTGTPHAEITGPAATANAHAWKLGDDAA